MIAASFKRFWPKDRLERLQAAQKTARKIGLRLVARNGGDRTVWLPHLAFWRGNQVIASFWNIDDAEGWLTEQEAKHG